MNINYYQAVSIISISAALPRPDQATTSTQRTLSAQSQYAFQPPLSIYLFYFCMIENM